MRKNTSASGSRALASKNCAITGVAPSAEGVSPTGGGSTGAFIASWVNTGGERAGGRGARAVVTACRRL